MVNTIVQYILLTGLLLLQFAFESKGKTAGDEELERWKKHANQVSISRDQWDVPHIYGKTDADAVFGLIYSQCEDDFKRVEMNYIGAMGRLAEVEGEKSLYIDLRQRLFTDTLKAIKEFKKCPAFMKTLMQAWADGINYYLFKNPDVRPLLIKHFQPWMPLLFSEGSIGGDISQVPVNRIEAFYSGNNQPEEEGMLVPLPEIRGSNGIAIAPGRTVNGSPLLLINPHTSYYFRSEVHASSEEGLNVYGAVTWGQFFIYQGFNETCGWMHTSCFTDVIDEYLETVKYKNGKYVYLYNGKLKSVREEKVLLRYKKAGVMASKEFTMYHTHHGPIVGKKGDKWIAIKLMDKPVKALTQSFMRNKSMGYDAFKNNMKLMANSSNNTVFADKEGNIAFWQGNFVPRRKNGIDPSGSLDGADPNTEWQGIHQLDEIIHFKNPKSGFLQNCNSSPYWATGNKKDLLLHPEYMGPDRQNYRAVHAIKLLQSDSAFTMDKLNKAAYDSWLPAFDVLIPSLLDAAKLVATTESKDHELVKEAYTLFELWDNRFSETSVATTLAVCWGNKLLGKGISQMPSGKWDELAIIDFLAEKVSPKDKIDLLVQTMHELEKDFGTWKVAWGEVNRFQRLTGKIEETYDDSKMSFAVPFVTAFWGSLATMDAQRYPETKRQYGASGNSFVAIVEFGEKVKARTIVTGGHSSNPSSPHFTDQAEMFCKGQMKEVYFYREDVLKNTVRSYHPGE